MYYITFSLLFFFGNIWHGVKTSFRDVKFVGIDLYPNVQSLGATIYCKGWF